MTTHSSALEEMHHIEPHVRVGRARIGVIMLIISDSLSLLAILAAGGYLNTLNTEGQFRAGDHAPAPLPGILLAIALVLSGLAYYAWARTVRRNGGAGAKGIFAASWALMVVAMAVQFWGIFTLGYSATYHAYASLVLLLSWFSVVHLLLAAIIGLLLLARLVRGRMIERQYDYIPQVVGYWWYYTVVASLLMWVFVLLLG